MNQNQQDPQSAHSLHYVHCREMPDLHVKALDPLQHSHYSWVSFHYLANHELSVVSQNSMVLAKHLRLSILAEEAPCQQAISFLDATLVVVGCLAHMQQTLCYPSFPWVVHPQTLQIHRWVSFHFFYCLQFLGQWLQALDLQPMPHLDFALKPHPIQKDPSILELVLCLLRNQFEHHNFSWAPLGGLCIQPPF